MVYVSSVDGEPVYESNRRRRNPWLQSEYSHSDAGSEYYYDQDGSRRNYGRAAATRFNPYGYARDRYDNFGAAQRRPEVRTYTLGPQPMGIDRLRAVSSRGYRQRYYEDDERLMQGRMDDPRMMQDPYLSRSTYPRFLVPGWGHILIGVFLLVIGLADIGYTANEYGDDCVYTGSDFDPGPCKANHVYTYVASPVWGGIFMVMTGAITFWMNAFRLRYNNWLLKAFCGLAVFLTLAVCPAIIVLNVLEITQNEDTFWKEGDGITLEDEAKFAFPIVSVILAFVDWVVAIICVCICICCPPRDLMFEQKPKYLPQPFIEPGYRREPMSREPVVIHEEVIQPPRRSEGGSRGPFSDVITRSGYRDERIPRASITAGPSHRERAPVVVYEERIPGGSRRGDDDVYSVYTDASQYSRGGHRGRTNYGYDRSEDYGRPSYYY